MRGGNRVRKDKNGFGLPERKREGCWNWIGLWGLMFLGEVMGLRVWGELGWWDSGMVGEGGGGLGDVSWRGRLVIGIVEVVVGLLNLDVEVGGEVEI